MAYQHHDFELRLRYAERLRLFVQSRLSDQEALKEAQHSSRRWELEAKEVVERVVQAKAERDAARHETTMARLKIEAMSGARTHVETELALIWGVSAATKDAHLEISSVTPPNKP